MGWSGFFQATTLSEDWRGYHQLARKMEERNLTNLQAQVILCYCRGLGPTEIGIVVGSERGNVGKALRIGVRRLVGQHPELRAIRSKWIMAVLHCFKNRRGGTYNPPVVFDSRGNFVSLRPKLLIAEDFESYRPTRVPILLDGDKDDLPVGTPERYTHDLDLFRELLASLIADETPEKRLEKLLPNELHEDPLVKLA